MNRKNFGPAYGNWVSKGLIKKTVVLLIVLTVAFVLAVLFIQGWIVLKIVLFFAMSLFAFFSIYFISSRRLFSENGADIQNKVINTLISYVEWDGNGKALDIGCGSGALTIKLARKYENARVTGIDYWGGSWGYHKKQCEENAHLEKVSERVDFIKASASKLPFERDSFDLAVSNMVFHEVRDCKNKIELIEEALRAVRRGGSFAFQDLFLVRAYYGPVENLLKSVESMGVSEVHFMDTSKYPFIPKILKLPFMLGRIGIIYGKK